MNPQRARDFAKAIGYNAKTDHVDAMVLAKMGSLLKLKPAAPKTELLQELHDLRAARQALIKDQTATKNREQMAKHSLLKRQLKARLKQIEAQLAEIDQAIRDLISQDPDLSEKLEILKSIPALGEITAFALLIELPELGTLDEKQVASLAGVAPVTRQSGTWKGHSFIRGGRRSVREALYMPILVATRYNPDLKEKYEQLIKAGKPPKVALIAIIRKMLILANALLRKGKKWVNHKLAPVLSSLEIS